MSDSNAATFVGDDAGFVEAKKSPAASSRRSSISSSSSIDDARFVPGTVLAERYRIVGLLGRGGMGEVYRAEDLSLAQPVALKFLPIAISQDTATLARFRREVRIARQVSHPNVCRVFDIGEVDGAHFLSMEYIDGEDLGSLLRRIGRLPADKALEISRQVCAGLAAAHDQGVLHRDLKPANIMVDGRGKARITDFGLAVLGFEAQIGEARAGTPGYMAPEQLTGKEVSVRSDVYSLGLVLYELFTGKRAFEAANGAELLRMQDQNAITSPTNVVKDLDPVVERVIMRCLEREPRSRPASALQVAIALPGGDPLAAALAAGETPSPEMVAASGETEGVSPVVAWGCMLFIAAAIAFGVWAGPRAFLLRAAPLEKSPTLLSERAQDILRTIGYTETPTDSAAGFLQDSEFLVYIAEHDPSQGRWSNREIGLISFWYRGSPQPLVNFDHFADVDVDHPPQQLSGMTSVQLSPRGRLLKLVVVPPQVETESVSTAASAPALPPDWTPLFAAAGLDRSKWTLAESRWTPPVFADARAAWNGQSPDRADTPMRIEAASYRGKPVYFELILPWTRPEHMQPYQLRTREKIAGVLAIAILLVLLIGSTLLARRNLRLGRGDRRGAGRLAALAFAGSSLFAIFSVDHVADLREIGVLLIALSWSVFIAAFLWALYIALEPLVRRRWPAMLVSWTRILAGRFRDPLVGRDVLLGCTAFSALHMVRTLGILMQYWSGLLPRRPIPPPPPMLRLLLGGRFAVGELADMLLTAIFFGLALTFLLFVFRVVLRRDWAAAAALAVLFTAIGSLQVDATLMSFSLNLMMGILLSFILLRCGLVAAIAGFLWLNLVSFPITTDISIWYAGLGALGLGLIALLVGFAFYTSLGGRPIFGAIGLED